VCLSRGGLGKKMKKEQISNEVMRDSIKELRDQYHKLFKASLTESSEYYHAMGIVAGLDIALQTLKRK
tara:strand:- start:995 stop:1198 length:204 start_codon:yes stop_codon:yes gene_type:complete